LAKRETKSRKQTKERKNRAMKIRGVKKVRSAAQRSRRRRHSTLSDADASLCLPFSQIKSSEKKK
jgi:hypothetical protein